MNGRIVVVTGATGGLGPAVVAKFRTAGDTVIGVARSAGDRRADLTDPEATKAVMDAIASEHGGIDVLAHVMGGYAGGQNVSGGAGDLWNRMLAVNFLSACYVCSSVLPHMTRAARGRIVAVGSRAGVQPAAGSAAYNASKAALNSLIQTIALEVKGSGVTANVVMPSTIDTAANQKWASPEQAADFVTPESIADVIFWLASAESADVNGALIPVYGRA